MNNAERFVAWMEGVLDASGEAIPVELQNKIRAKIAETRGIHTNITINTPRPPFASGGLVAPNTMLLGERSTTGSR